MYRKIFKFHIEQKQGRSPSWAEVGNGPLEKIKKVIILSLFFEILNNWILLFTQKDLLIPKWNDQCTSTHVNSHSVS